MPAITAEKQRGRPLTPDQSGNPAGRPKRARNKATILAEALVETLIDRALAGNVAAIRVCLDRVAPQHRDRAAFDLPEIHSLSDAVDASAALIAAVAAGQIAPREAERVMMLISQHMVLLDRQAVQAPEPTNPAHCLH